MLEIEFHGPRGFRLLDEGDLIRYWEAKVFDSSAPPWAGRATSTRSPTA